ncbi:hypothetical protein [Methanoregula sp.]|uniref:hypothetical protein n=1 Tax=Methanoregula sp. TaxID=2052170 RepID=UPI002623BC88|nr:hypothetical protein [Methanoregula sp.]MDD5141986.1 hypothetical protein [Methanoregula sp.]
MFDTKTSCILRGTVGIIFGLLALFVPELTLGTFYGMFWILIILGIALFGFLAITGKGDESSMWFLLAAALLVAGVLSIIVADFVSILFVLIIAGVAFYNGFTDITLSLQHPRTKYIFIPAMVLFGLALLGALFYYYPGFANNLSLSIVGTLAIAFSIFSILLGLYRPGGADNEPVPVTASTTHKPGRRS